MGDFGEGFCVILQDLIQGLIAVMGEAHRFRRSWDGESNCGNDHCKRYPQANYGHDETQTPELPLGGTFGRTPTALRPAETCEEDKGRHNNTGKVDRTITNTIEDGP